MLRHAGILPDATVFACPSKPAIIRVPGRSRIKPMDDFDSRAYRDTMGAVLHGRRDRHGQRGRHPGRIRRPILRVALALIRRSSPSVPQRPARVGRGFGPRGTSPSTCWPTTRRPLAKSSPKPDAPRMCRGPRTRRRRQFSRGADRLRRMRARRRTRCRRPHCRRGSGPGVRHLTARCPPVDLLPRRVRPVGDGLVPSRFDSAPCVIRATARVAPTTVLPRGMEAPWTESAAEDARNSTTLAMWSGGTQFENLAFGMSARLVGVSMMLGRMQLTLMPLALSSSARVSVSRMTTLFDAT